MLVGASTSVQMARTRGQNGRPFPSVCGITSFCHRYCEAYWQLWKCTSTRHERPRVLVSFISLVLSACCGSGNKYSNGPIAFKAADGKVLARRLAFNNILGLSRGSFTHRVQSTVRMLGKGNQLATGLSNGLAARANGRLLISFIHKLR